MEKIPKGQACVVLSKHQSPWETFYLQLLFAPLSTILKKELLKIPAFGWGIGLMKPIAIDRANPRQSLNQLMEQGADRLNEGISVLVFPEGTRTDPGEVVKYARGGANLAKKNHVPLVFVAHNAGECWPAHRFMKIPGRITVVISDPVEVEDATALELTNLAKEWIEARAVEISQR